MVFTRRDHTLIRTMETVSSNMDCQVVSKKLGDLSESVSFKIKLSGYSRPSSSGINPEDNNADLIR